MFKSISFSSAGLLCMALILSCQSFASTSDRTGLLDKKQDELNRGRGTADGGGGNSVANPQTGGRTLLDLAENIDKEPFDFNVKKLLHLDRDETNPTQTTERSLAWSKYINYNKLNDTEFMKNLIGADEEFFIWALRTALTTNEELASGFSRYDTTYQIHLDAYGLKDDKIVKSVSFAKTEEELPDFGDTGVIQVPNPNSKKQLAVQDKTGFVLINKSEFEKLDVDNQIALKLHETVLYLVLKFNPDLVKIKGTAPIREFVKNFLNYAYFSPIKNMVIVAPETVKKSYLALGFPKIYPDYSLIGKISDAAKNNDLDCKLKQFILKDGSPSANYVFVKNGVEVSGVYSMDGNFFFKVQLYLVKNGICTFKPEPCTIKYFQLPWENKGGYRLSIKDTPLPDSSDDILYMQGELKKKYQIARICQ